MPKKRQQPSGKTKVPAKISQNAQLACVCCKGASKTGYALCKICINRIAALYGPKAGWIDQGLGKILSIRTARQRDIVTRKMAKVLLGPPVDLKEELIKK